MKAAAQLGGLLAFVFFFIVICAIVYLIVSGMIERYYAWRDAVWVDMNKIDGATMPSHTGTDPSPSSVPVKADRATAQSLSAPAGVTDATDFSGRELEHCEYDLYCQYRPQQCGCRKLAGRVLNKETP